MSNPYLDLLNDDKDEDEQNPYLSLVEEPEGDDFTTAVGRRNADFQARSRLVEAATSSLNKPGISQQRKQTLQRIIERNKPIDELGFAGENTEHGSLRRLAGGIVGAVPALGMAAADLALALPAKLGVGIAQAGRRQLAEGQAALTEVSGAEGIEGLAGNLIGGAGGGSALNALGKAKGAIGVAGRVLGAPAELFGRAAQGTLKIAGKASPTIARVADKAVTGTVAQRTGANVIGGVPINAAQALSMDDATLGDRARAMVLGVAGDIAAGVLPTKLPTIKKPSAAADAATGAPPKPGARADAAADLVKQGETKAAERKAASALEQEARIKARQEWGDANPGKSWKNDLSKNDRRALIDEWKNRAGGGTPEGAVTGVEGAAPVGVDAAAVPPAETPAQQIERLTIENRQLEDQAYTDPVTKLHNRAAFDKHIERIGKDNADTDYTVVDLQALHERNNLHGQGAGDDFLQRAGSALQAAAESLGLDARNVYRIGGDEFAVVAPKGLGDKIAAAAHDIFGEHDTGAPGRTNKLLSATGASVEAAYAGLKDIKLGRTAEAGTRVENSQQLERPPGVPADAPSTVNIFSRIDELGLSAEVGSAFRVRLAQSPDPEMAHMQAELAARNTIDSYEELTAQGLTPDQARAAIRAEHEQVMADPMVDKPFVRPVRMSNSDPSPQRLLTPPEAPAVAPQQAPQGGTPRRLKSWPDGPDLESITIVDETNAPRGVPTIDGMKDRINDLLEAHPPGQAPPHLYEDMDAVIARQKQIESAARQTPENPTGEAPKFVTAETPAKKAQLDKPLSGAEFLALLKTPAKQMSPVDGQRMLEELNRRVANLFGEDAVAAPYVQKMNEIREMLIDKSTPKKDGGPIVLNTRREIGGAIAGYFGGSMMGDTEEERARYAVIGALIGAGLAHGAPKIFKPTQRTSLVPKETLSIVKSSEDIKGAKKAGSFLERAREIYWERIRFANGMEGAVQKLTGGKALAVEKDPGKMSAMFGRWIARSEQWLTGTPVIEDIDGNMIELPVLQYAKADGTPVGIRNVHDIAKLVDGDTEGLGKLAAARSALELYGTEGRKTPGIDLIEAQKLWANMPEEYHIAADAMRDMHKALVYAETAAGIHTPEAAQKITAERYYAAMEKAFNAPAAEGDVDAKGQHVIGSPTSVKGRQKGTLAPIKNPFETFIAHIGRAQRAIEINQIKNRLIDLVDANPEIGHLYAKRIDKNYRDPTTNKPLVNDATDARVDILSHELGITKDDASSIVAAYGGDKLDPTAPVMTIFRDGAKRTYRLNKGVAATIKAFRPEEIGLFWQMLAAPTQWARTGIVNNPVFITRQAWRDNWQAMMNSQYGFRWGLDWISGYVELMKGGKKSQEFIKAGGGTTSFALRDVLSAEKSLQHVKTPGKNPIDTAILRIKEMSIPEAWHALVTPMAEAARMGEFLRARGRGASPVEAAYAAKQVTGNFQQHGTKMRGFANAALFLNPALQAMDQTMFVAGLHPFRGTPEGKTRTGAALTYAAKGTAIGLTSAAFWAANQGDEEISELRKSESGRGFWFWRDGKGELHKTAKPIFEGQLFGTTMEMALDKFVADDPESAHAFVQAMLRDASVNLLPVAGVVPASLWANKDINTGGEIAPEGAGDPEFATRSNTSQPARVIGDALGPVSKWIMDQTQGGSLEAAGETLARAMSPAGIDYLVRNLGGTLAQDALLGVTQAVQYQETGYIPAKDELPIIRGAMVRYPNTYTASIQEFYRNAERIERVAESFATLAKKDAPGAMEYFLENKADITKIDLYSRVRQDLADMRQAIEDMKQAPVGSFDLQSIKDFEKSIVLRMIELAKQANLVAKSVK